MAGFPNKVRFLRKSKVPQYYRCIFSKKTSFLRWLAALQAALPVAVAVFWYCVHFAVKRLAVDRIEIRKIDRQAIQRFVLRTFLQQSSDLIRYYLCTALYCIAAHTANQAALEWCCKPRARIHTSFRSRIPFTIWGAELPRGASSSFQHREPLCKSLEVPDGNWSTLFNSMCSNNVWCTVCIYVIYNT